MNSLRRSLQSQPCSTSRCRFAKARGQLGQLPIRLERPPYSPFFASPELATVLAKITAVDGLARVPQALVDRYHLTPEEAILWERHLGLVWMGLEADYSLSGKSRELKSSIRKLLAFPDNQVYWENSTFFGAEFREYVEGMREGR